MEKGFEENGEGKDEGKDEAVVQTPAPAFSFRIRKVFSVGFLREQGNAIIKASASQGTDELPEGVQCYLR